MAKQVYKDAKVGRLDGVRAAHGHDVSAARIRSGSIFPTRLIHARERFATSTSRT